MKVFDSINDIELDPEHHGTVQKWLDRGDGCAVYENAELGHPEAGHRQFISFGSPVAQIETDPPPNRLPDIGAAINWRYYLVGTLRTTDGG
jgi:hypothetical protein